LFALFAGIGLATVHPQDGEALAAAILTGRFCK